MTLKGKPAPLTERIKADIRNQICSLTDVPKHEQKFMVSEATISIQSGGDLHRFVWAFVEIGIEKSRAVSLADGINRRASAMQNVERQLALGIKEAIWQHSGLQCFSGELPETEVTALASSHKHADGHRFRLDTGLLVGGRLTFPGLQWGCKCLQKPLIPGIDE